MDYDFTIDIQNQQAQLAERIHQYADRIAEYTNHHYEHTI